jgi:hypothetical protein
LAYSSSSSPLSPFFIFLCILPFVRRSPSDHYAGNTLKSDGSVHVNLATKATTELEVATAKAAPAWAALEALLVQVARRDLGGFCGGLKKAHFSLEAPKKKTSFLRN